MATALLFILDLKARKVDGTSRDFGDLIIYSSVPISKRSKVSELIGLGQESLELVLNDKVRVEVEADANTRDLKVLNDY